MPLTLPNLDDRTFADLIAEARASIPAYAPEWTDHNESDPGITLVELFAFLTEMLLYRVNRVTDANRLAFLQLINGPNWSPSPEATLAEQIRQAVLQLRVPNRAVTCADYERLALQADARVARARCLARRNLDSENPGAPAFDKPGHMSVVIVPSGSDSTPQPTPDLLQRVKNDLEPRRLLTTQVHVVGPRYMSFGVRVTLVLKQDAGKMDFLFALDSSLHGDLDSRSLTPALRQALATQGLNLSSKVQVSIVSSGSRWLIADAGTSRHFLVVMEAGALNVYADLTRTAAARAVRTYLDPLNGGPDGTGWPYGRNVFVSEIYARLDALAPVDYVTQTRDSQNTPLEVLTLPPSESGRRITSAGGDLVGIVVEPDELIDVESVTFDLDVVSPGS